MRDFSFLQICPDLSWWWWVTMGISAHCGREVSLVNYFILCVVRLGVTPVNYFGKINLADALQSLIQEGIWNSFSEFRNGIRRGLLLHLDH